MKFENKGKWVEQINESKSINEDIFKPAIPEKTLLKNIDTSLSWLNTLLKDMKRKLEPKWSEYWDTDDIKDIIKDIETVIKLLNDMKSEF